MDDHFGRKFNVLALIYRFEQYISNKLGSFADQTQLARAVIYRGLQREAASLAFNDAFFIQALLFLGLLGLLWII